MIKFAEKPISKVMSDSVSGFIPPAASAQQTFGAFGVEISNGLSKTVASQRLLRDGTNQIKQKKQITIWRILWDQFSSIVGWLLTFPAIIAWLTRNHLEAVAILVVLAFNAIIGFAIKGGRTIYANILKFVHLIFSHNLGEVLTDVSHALAFAVKPRLPEIIDQSLIYLLRRSFQTKTKLSNRFCIFDFLVGVVLAAISLAAYVRDLSEYGDGIHAHKVALISLNGI